MHDQRVAYLRGVLDELVESLDATTRIQRWTGSDPVPEPLRRDAELLVSRLASANRLASDKFSGSPKVVSAMTGLSIAIQRLDAAFVAYRESLDKSSAGDAGPALEAEIARARAALQS